MQNEIEPQANYRQILMDHYELLRAKNPKLSLRQFAVKIGLTSANLSDVLKGRCGLSPQAADRIAESLDLTKRESRYFSDLVAASNARSKAERIEAQKRLEKRKLNRFGEPLPENEYSILEHFEDLAVLEVIDLSKAPSTAAVLAHRLNMKLDTVTYSLARLQAAGFIKTGSGGTFARTGKSVWAESETPSSAIQTFHKQVLEYSKLKLQTQQPAQRKFSTTFFTFDKSKTAEAKQFIEEMEQQFFDRFASDDSSANSIYYLAAQFYRLDENDV